MKCDLGGTYSDIIGEATNVSSVRLISECMTGYAPVVKYMFLTPVELTGGDFFIDVDHDVVGAVSREDKQEDTIAYMLNSGILGSAMESGIFKQMLQTPSVSTIELLTVANKRGIPIYTINKSNADKINELTVSNSVKTDISNAVNSGKVVVIPKDEMNYYNWKGTGYIIMNPGTGAAGYMISGGLAGGSSAIDIAFTSIAGITDLLVCVYSGLDILLALSTPTSLIMIGVYFGLYILDYMAFQSMFNDLVMYWKTGDSQYATPLKVNFIISMAFFGFKILSITMPDGNTLFRHIVNYVKEWLGISTKYGDDVAKIVAEAGEAGTEVITKYSDNAVRIIRTYKDDGLIALYCYGDDLMEQVAKFGDDAVGSVINFGGEDALIAMQNGIEPSLINKLDSLGIKTVDFEEFGIISHEIAETVTEFITAARAAGIVEADIPASAEFLTRSAGQFGETSNVISAFKYLSSGDFTSFANMLDLSTPAGKAVFWSGDKAAAIRYAESIGGSALETTPGGKLLNDWNWLSQKFPTWADGAPTDQRPLWRAVSSRYANLVEGPVTVVRPGGEAGTGGFVWTNDEYPILMRRNIDINYVDSFNVN